MSTDPVAGATELWRHLGGTIDFFGQHGRPMPAPEELAHAVRAGAVLLPRAYVGPYVEPVEQGLDKLLTLAKAGRIRMSSVEIVTGGIVQHALGWPMATELRRFVAVISNLYRSFLDNSRRAAAGMPVLKEQLPPLGAFQHDGSDGPITIAVDLMNQFLGGSVGVVALPATFAAHPILWMALAHETGGHDVTHADEGLLEELAEGMPGALKPFEADVGLPEGQLALLWQYWMDEAAADIYALMNAGPAFVENAAVVLAAMGGGTRPTLRLESRVGGKGLIDPHPTDILRLHLALGAIGTLRNFSERETAMARIRAIGETFGQGEKITLEGLLPYGGQRAIPLAAEVPREAMGRAAEAVGRYIATVRLVTLGGKSIQAIESWDDEDEIHVATVRNAIAAGKPIDALGDDAQLLAAVSAAAIENPGEYDRLTSLLNAALDHSFDTDPVWSFNEPDRMYIRYPRRRGG